MKAALSGAAGREGLCPAAQLTARTLCSARIRAPRPLRSWRQSVP